MFRSLLASLLFFNFALASAQQKPIRLGTNVETARLQAPSQKEGKYFIKWKFHTGDTFYAVQDTKMQQSMSFMGQDIDMKIKAETVIRYRIKETKKDVTVVEMTFLRQKMEMDGPAALPGLDLGEKLKNVTFTFTIDDKGNVVKLEGYDKFLQALADEDPMTAAMLRSVLPESVIRQSFGQTFSLTPDKPLALGESWHRKDKMSLGPLGNAEVNTRYELKDVRDSLARLSIGGEMKWTGGDDGMVPKIPFKISDADIKTDKFEGSATFDLNKGRLERAQMTMNLKGSLSFAIMDQKLTMDLKQQMQTVTKIVDKNPVTD